MVSIDDYKGINYTDIDRRHAKILLGAMSCMYDNVQKRMGLNSQDLRNIVHRFESNCGPRDDYQVLKKIQDISFNYFHAEDIYEVASGWTDYGDELWKIIGFKIKSDPFRIVVVEFRKHINPLFPDDSNLTFVKEYEIPPLIAFQFYGIGLFRYIANMEDWKTIICSFDEYR